MKKSTFSLLIMIIIMIIVTLTSCERKSHRLPVQATSDLVVKVLDTYPEKIMTDVGLYQYKTKVITEDSVVYYILTNNEFNHGDKIIVKKYQIIKN